MIAKQHFIDSILPITLKWEQGYSNDSRDNGGETYRGITRKHHPMWSGWRILERYKPLRRGDIINDEALKIAVRDLYWAEYFKANHLDELNSSIVAIQCFDFMVVGGFSHHKLQERLVGVFGLDIKVDGIIGSKTIAAMNTIPSARLAEQIIDLRLSYHRSIETPDNEWAKAGWKNRIEFFTKAIKLIQ